jgi:hypothetical protein
MSKQLGSVVSKVATAILTIAGLIALPIQVAQQTHSTRLGIALAALVALFLGVPAAYHLIPGPVQRRFGVRRYQAPAILVDCLEHVIVDETYHATIETTSTLVFLEQPSEGELVDIVDVLPHETIEETAYSSTDSTAIDVIRKSPSTLAVRWRPRTPIRKFVPYVHKTKYRIPSLYGDDGFYQVMYVDRDTGSRRWEFITAFPIERAIAFVLPAWRWRATLSYLLRRAVSGKSRGCDQPSIDATGRRITWEVSGPRKGRIYVLFATYEGMRSRIEDQAADFTLLGRLRRLLGISGGSRRQELTPPA